MIRNTTIFVGFLILFGYWVVTPVFAEPLGQGSTVSVRVCYDTVSCTSPTVNNTDKPPSFGDYIEHVLSNEWHGNANIDALKAGTIAIRTFSYRDNPCGAIKNTFSEPNTNPQIVSTVLDNRTQAYKIGGKSGSQNPVTTGHTNAQSQTSNILLYRTDNVYACAKYNANNGNPTKSCASANCTGDTNDRATLLEIADPVDTNNIFGARYAVGMSENGSVAWSVSSSPWNYRQILTHYYTMVKIGALEDAKYRWVWLNTGITTVHTGYSGEQYIGPVPAAPISMRAGASYQVRMYLQNTGTEQWTYSTTPSTSFRLVYQWCDTSGANCGTQSTTAIGLSTAPGATLTFYPIITAPAQTGAKLLKIDMMTNNGTLFSTYQSQNWPTQNTTVDIRSATGNVFLPWAASAPSGTPPSQ